jgi:hypothetical protein
MRSMLQVAWLSAEAEVGSPTWLPRSVLLLVLAWCVSWEAILLGAPPWYMAFGLLVLVLLTTGVVPEPGTYQGPAHTLPLGPVAARLGEALGTCVPPLGVLWAASAGLAVSGALWLPWLVEATASGTVSTFWLGLVVHPDLLGLNADGRAVALGLPTPWRAAATTTALVLLVTPFRAHGAREVELWTRLPSAFAWMALITLWLWASPGETLLARTAPLVVLGAPLGAWTSTRWQSPLWTPLAARAPTLVRLNHREGPTAVLREVVWHAPFVRSFVALMAVGCLLSTLVWLAWLQRLDLPMLAPPWELVAASSLTCTCLSALFLPAWVLGGLPSTDRSPGSRDGHLAELVELLPVTRRRLVANIVLGTLLAAAWILLIASQVWSLELGEIGVFSMVSTALLLGHIPLSAMTRRPRERHGSYGLIFVTPVVWIFGLLSMNLAAQRAAFAWSVGAFLVGSALALRRPR